MFLIFILIELLFRIFIVFEQSSFAFSNIFIRNTDTVGSYCQGSFGLRARQHTFSFVCLQQRQNHGDTHFWGPLQTNSFLHVFPTLTLFLSLSVCEAEMTQV